MEDNRRGVPDCSYFLDDFLWAVQEGTYGLRKCRELNILVRGCPTIGENDGWAFLYKVHMCKVHKNFRDNLQRYKNPYMKSKRSIYCEKERKTL